MKLSLDALKLRAEATTSNDLLVTISGGTENSCHDSEPPPTAPPTPTPPTTSSVSHEINVNINYGPNGWSGGAGYKIKF